MGALFCIWRLLEKLTDLLVILRFEQSSDDLAYEIGPAPLIITLKR
jgi:hypothetical protein